MITVESLHTLVSVTTLLCRETETQLPPPSFKVKAVTPAPDSTTSKLPLSSKAIPRGVVRPVATSLTSNPGATEGAGTVVETLTVHEDAEDWAFTVARRLAMSTRVVVDFMADVGGEKSYGRVEGIERQRNRMNRTP